MSSLQLNHLCSKLPISRKNYRKIAQTYPYQEKNYQNISCISQPAQLLTRRYLCSWTNETNYNSNEHQKCVSWNKLNKSLFIIKSLDWNRLLRDGTFGQKQVHQLVHKIIKVSPSTHFESWVCCTAGWESRWITTSIILLCVSISWAGRRQLMSFSDPELTNCSISLDLWFSNALIVKLIFCEIFVWVIRSSNLFHTSERKVTKNVPPFLKYNNIYQKINQNFNQAIDLMTEAPMVNSNSTMCASLSIYISHLGFSTNFNGIASDFVWINDVVLKRFLAHRLSQ